MSDLGTLRVWDDGLRCRGASTLRKIGSRPSPHCRELSPLNSIRLKAARKRCGPSSTGFRRFYSRGGGRPAQARHLACACTEKRVSSSAFLEFALDFGRLDLRAHYHSGQLGQEPNALGVVAIQLEAIARRPTPSANDAVDGAHSAASKCHRVVAVQCMGREGHVIAREANHVEGVVHGRG